MKPLLLLIVILFVSLLVFSLVPELGTYGHGGLNGHSFNGGINKNVTKPAGHSAEYLRPLSRVLDDYILI